MRLFTICSTLLMVSCGVRQAEMNALSNPNDPAAWERLGNAHRLAMHYSQASDAYQIAMELDPARTHLASRTKKRTSKHTQTMRREALKNPNDDEVWGDLGDMLRQEGDLAGALNAYLKAFHIDPSDGEWHTALSDLGAGELILNQSRDELNPNDDESIGDWADILMSMGREEEACEHYTRAAELDPEDEEWWNYADQCGFEIPEGYGRDTDTGYGGYHGIYSLSQPQDLESLEAAVNNDANLLVRLGQAYAKAGEKIRAEDTLWGALLVSPTDEEGLQSYMAVTKKSRREVLEKLRSHFEEDDELIGLLADHFLDLGMADRALDLYQLAHQLDQEDPEWKAKKELLEATR
ncbi:MAG: tetratricopeptide repeat protein [Proteobacteria bacterium]|jgi:tetratricopeptide (TPR) repeat protein|nr:tetratricopeptide repeat protein [Pseudomonadota bacterium]